MVSKGWVPLFFLLFVSAQIGLYRPLGLEEVVVTENFVYLAPLEHHHIYQMDLEGNLRRVIGRKGEGPGEFDFVSLVGNRGDQILAVSTRRRSPPFEFSAEGNLIAEHRLPESLPTDWVYKTAKGWLFLEAEKQRIRFFQTQENFGNPKMIVEEPKQLQEKDFRYNKVFWVLSRNRNTFFLVRKRPTELLIVALGQDTTTVVPLNISPIPDPQSESGFLGKKDHLPLVTDLVAGPTDTCLLYSGEHLLHKHLKPRVFKADGSAPDWDFSAESWRRLLEIRGNWAWITTFDEENGAGVRKLEMADVDSYVAAHPIIFSEEDRQQYMRKTLRRSTN